MESSETRLLSSFRMSYRSYARSYARSYTSSYARSYTRFSCAIKCYRNYLLSLKNIGACWRCWLATRCMQKLIISQCSDRLLVCSDSLILSLIHFHSQFAYFTMNLSLAATILFCEKTEEGGSIDQKFPKQKITFVDVLIWDHVRLRNVIGGGTPT